MFNHLDGYYTQLLHEVNDSMIWHAHEAGRKAKRLLNGHK